MGAKGELGKRKSRWGIEIRYKLCLVFCWLVLGVPASSLTAWANAPKPDVDDFFPGVSSYQPSYFGWATLGEAHAEFQVSIKYPLLPFEVFGVDASRTFVGLRSGLYVAYTGRYDFFLKRYSAPVISRIQNPGAYFDFNRCFDQPLTLSAGYFHESNGQVVDTPEKYQAISEHAQDFVSRGWDYALLGGAYTLPLPELDEFLEKDIFVVKDGWLHQIFYFDPKADKSNLAFAFQGMAFLNKQGFGTSWKEEDVFWTPVARQPTRSDYDGLRFSLVFENAHLRISETVRSGYTAFNLSSESTLTFRIRKWFPISIRYYSGYGPELAFYQAFSRSLIVGLELYDYQTR